MGSFTYNAGQKAFDELNTHAESEKFEDRLCGLLYKASEALPDASEVQKLHYILERLVAPQDRIQLCDYLLQRMQGAAYSTPARGSNAALRHFARSNVEQAVDYLRLAQAHLDAAIQIVEYRDETDAGEDIAPQLGHRRSAVANATMVLQELGRTM